MTSRHGHRAHWGAALIIAPGAAAIFGATTSWAMQVTPPGSATVKAPVKPPVSVRVVPNRDFLAARRAVAAKQRQLVVLRVRVKNLRQQLTALAKPLPAVAGTSGGSTGQGWAAPGGGSGGNAQAPAARWAPAPAHNVQRAYAPQASAPHAAAPRSAAPPAAAPPVHAVTGAS
jgi:hypothetical protein